MADNRVIPQIDPSTGSPVMSFSIGTVAKDLLAGNISSIETINILSAVNSFALINPIGTNTLSNVVTGYFKKYAAGSNLQAQGTDNTDIHLSALVNAQSLYFTLATIPESVTTYHTAKDGQITLTFTKPDTFQRTVASWKSYTTRAGDATIYVNGSISTVVNQDPYSATPTITLASGLRDGYYTVTVRDNASGFYLATVVSVPYGGSSNTYVRAPNRLSTNGVWSSYYNQGYA